MIPIDKGIPLPKQRTPRKYPFAEMKVGDSFEFPPSLSNHSARSAAHQASLRLGLKFTVSKALGSVRCWRVK